MKIKIWESNKLNSISHNVDKRQFIRLHPNFNLHLTIGQQIIGCFFVYKDVNGTH